MLNAVAKNDIYLENQLLRRQLRSLLAQAKKNEQKLQRIQSQELNLISTNSLAELVQKIIYDYRTSVGLDIVSLCLVDPEHEIRRILQDEGIAQQDHPNIVFLPDDESLKRIYGISVIPKLGAYDGIKHANLFNQPSQALASVALLPLVRQNKLIGSVNLGSNLKDRFVINAATDFLERLTGIVAVCLENATNHGKLKRIGLTDPLTNVNNRRFFDQRLKEEITKAQRTGEPLCCLLLDIDRFKSLNDNYGHQLGDSILIDVAALIRAQMRGSDVMARYGGEEFSALLSQTTLTDAMDIAQRIRQSIEGQRFPLSKEDQIGVTLSIGVAMLPESINKEISALGQILLERADQALYAAKDAGRNRVECFS